MIQISCSRAAWRALGSVPGRLVLAALLPAMAPAFSTAAATGCATATPAAAPESREAIPNQPQTGTVGTAAAGRRTNSVPEVELEYKFRADLAHRVTDTSGRKNHGSERGALRVSARELPKGRWFDGSGFIEVTKTPTLNPAHRPWTIEAVVKPASPEGMILARGGKAQGYALWLEHGRPVFRVIVRGQPTTLTAPTPVTARATLTGLITAEHRMELYVDGRLAGSAALADFIERDPQDSMQIGADTGSPVVEPQPPWFRGWMERVTLWRGARRPVPPAETRTPREDT